MDSLKIKIATGWERGADGKWRYETKDLEIKDKTFGKRMVEGYSVPEKMMLSDVIEDEELFAAYPKLKEAVVSMSFDSTEGSFLPSMNWISLNERYFNKIYDAETENKIEELKSKIDAIKNSEKYKKEEELQREADEKFVNDELSIENFPSFPTIESLSPYYFELMIS